MPPHPMPPYHGAPVEWWETLRAIYERGLERDPDHKPTRAVIRVCDFYIAHARG